MNIRIMLFIVMMMVMPVSYAACYSELSVQHNLVVQGDFALTQTQMATYEFVMREYKYYHPYEPVGYYCWTL